MLSVLFTRYFLDRYEVFIYSLQYSLYQLLSWQNSIGYWWFICIFFCVGLTTIFTPCFISMLPLIFSYLNSNGSYQISKSFFIFGVVNSVLFMFLVSHFFNLYFLVNKLSILSHLLLLLISLNLMQIIDFSFLLKIFYLNFPSKTMRYNFPAQSYLVGLIIGVSSIPCNTSIIFLVTSWLSRISNVFFLFIYLFVYLLGCLLPLIIIFSIKYTYKSFSRFTFIWNILVSSGGSFIFVSSLLSLLKMALI
uniref:Thiol:disulfide interchange protein n=1 Tax=Osmundaria fimbriata TaxID=228265 RepID=A0A1Z1M3S4_OSMFI|nr:thiol:disulfide interchange protein [Osmundaria fimbriata]ARW60747.1 thiol:disulfide interchange protein [Osmundaria fimbriata]